MAQITLNSTGVASSGALVLQSNGTTTAVTISTAQVATLEKDAVVNGLAVGRGAGAVATNTAVGASALAGSNSGSGYNTGIGASTLLTNSTGVGNTALGHSAMYANTTGSSNVAIGAYDGSNEPALRFNTTGGSQVAVGVAALKSNTTGGSNVAVGFAALQANTTASNNTAVGYQALYNSNSTLGCNTAVGHNAGVSLTTGGGNTFIGRTAGNNATTGSKNTFVGGSDGNTNYGAGYFVSTGYSNTIVGCYNGNQGGLDIRASSNYIVLSDGDGNPRQVYNDTGGTSLGTAPLNVSGIRGYELGLGGAAYHGNSSRSYTSQNAYWNNSNWIRAVTGYAVQVTYDNSNGTLSTGTAGSGSAGTSISFTTGPYLANLGTSWTNSSDERLKDITGEIQNGLEKVCTLRAATFTWKDSENKSPQVGLIAQDVQAVLPEVVVVPDVEFDGTAKTALGVNYDQVIPLLVAAIKELKAEFDAYKEAHP
jgi:hypothetical protein